jgi:hypothetical protein
MGAYLSDSSVDYSRSGVIVTSRVIVDDLTLEATK